MNEYSIGFGFAFLWMGLFNAIPTSRFEAMVISSTIFIMVLAFQFFDRLENKWRENKK